MSRFRLLKHLLASTGGGGGGGGSPTVTYDTRFGSTDTSTGWITFALGATNRRIWVDATSGNDTTGDGLSAATAVKTLAKGALIYGGAGFKSGDQLMLAGTGARTYTDAGATNAIWRNALMLSAPGSLAYPSCVLSYDPADPANSAKYGKLLGADRPRVQLNFMGDPTQSSVFLTDYDYIFVQGIEFDGSLMNGALGNAIGYRGPANAGRAQTGLGWQNTIWNQCELKLDIDETATSANWAQTIHISKSGGYGQWSNDGTGNISWLYIAGTKNLYLQDCVAVHSGWNLARTRNDTDLTTGAANYYGHGIYYAATNSGGQISRVVGIDCAQDPFSLRGAHSASCLVSLDNPIVGSIGGFSSPTSIAEAPNGVVVTWDDVVAMGGDNIQNNPSLSRGMGPGCDNTLAGSHLKNVAMFDNPEYGGVNNYTYAHEQLRAGQVPAYLTVDTARSYSFAPVFETNGGTYASNVHISYQNCIADTYTAAMANDTFTSCTTYSGAPAGYKTRDQVLTAALTEANLTPSGVDYAHRKAQLVNYLLEYPHLAGQVAMALDTKGLASLGLTPTTHPATTMPDLSGLTAPRSVY